MSSYPPNVATPVTSEGQRAIEALRALAMLLLICYHVALIAPWANTNISTLATQRIASAGWIGTDLSLAIAGFLCVVSLNRANSYPSWLLRRATRVLPAYFAWLVIYLYVLPKLLAASGYAPESHITYQWLDLAWSHGALFWTMTTNFIYQSEKHAGASLDPLLTIALGAQLTILTSIFFRIRNGRLLPIFLIAMVLSGVVLRSVWVGQLQTLPWRSYSFPLTRCDAFVAGAGAAWLLANPRWAPPLRKASSRILKISLGLLAASFVVTQGLRVLEPVTILATYPIIGLACGSVVLTASQLATISALKPLRRAIAWLSKIGPSTYSIYLIKLPFLYVVRDAFAKAGVAMTIFPFLAVGLVLTPAGGWAWYRLIELPLARLFGRGPLAGIRARNYPENPVQEQKPVPRQSIAPSLLPIEEPSDSMRDQRDRTRSH